VNPFSKFLVKAYAEAADESASQLTEDLRTFAIQLGWPKEISAYLSIGIVDGEYVIQYPPMFKDQILTLEYGTEVIPPSPALRSFIQELYETDMETEVGKHLQRAGLV
jgi:hypothetical protein